MSEERGRMASEYRQIFSTRHSEASEGDFLIPGSSDGKYCDSTGEDQGSKHLAVDKGSSSEA